MTKPTPHHQGIPRVALRRAPLYILFIPFADELQLILTIAVLVILMTLIPPPSR